MTSRNRRSRTERGFALVITLSLMVLLTIIAIGLLTLGSISLRSAGAGDAQAQAYANARMAVMMAIGQLQKQAGDDRRITADASIADTAAQGHLVGTWNSWTPDFANNPAKATVNYTTQKANTFRSWLISHPDSQALKNRAWADAPAGGDWVKLYSLKQNGFDLNAPPVPVKDGGTVAWAVVQENTKAKVNVGGPDDMKGLPSNVALQVQRRPSLHGAEGLKAAERDFNLRANKVLSSNQVELDEALIGTGSLTNLDASFTTQSQGLLTDAVRGGLKADMSLGFEMSETEFKKGSWEDVPNPFRKDGFKGTFAIPTSYAGQVPLFRPLIENPLISYVFDFAPASVSNRFNGAGVPTFDHLRSFYRLPHYMYGSAAAPTVAERAPDHIAAKNTGASGGTYLSPAKSLSGTRSVTGIKPVLNRVVYLLSLALGGDNEVRLVLAPMVSLWNPYNTALEIDGAVAYPWIDVPFSLDWNIVKASGEQKNYNGIAMSLVMGYQFEGQNHGRQVNPYFLCQMTGSGTNNLSKPIRFEPGEVRVFAPANATPREYNRRDDTATSKAVWMRPVDNVGQLTTKGGLMVPMKGGIGGHGFTEVLASGDKVRLTVRDNGPGNYHYFVSLEDAGRIRTPVSLSQQGGQATAEVQMCGYLSSSIKNGANPQSPYRTFAELKAGGLVPFGVLETYERCTLPGSLTSLVSDLAYTVNPRQTYLTHYLSAGNLAQSGNNRGAPHWVSTLRIVPSFDGAIQTTTDGRRSFWGPSHELPQGQSVLPFFELPREPMLSLASFQHMDMSSSTYSSANQFGNSWASPWLRRTQAAVRNQTYVVTGVPIYDTPYLTNEALWDGYFLSGAAPRLGLGSNPASLRTAYDNEGFAPEQRSLSTVIKGFVEDPLNQPLANPRMRLHKGGTSEAELIKLLESPAGCARIAAHLMVDGAFNINSTDVNAWIAVLSGLRGEQFELQDTGTSPSSDTAFPRFRHPTGALDNNWNGFRALNDDQIKTLATGIVDQVKKRGPFLSLAEFVNRRIENTDYGKAGAIQLAIDQAKFNESTKQTALPTPSILPTENKPHTIQDTGVGIPGYLTQADVLQSLAPVITCRSDTFTIRGYGEAKDSKGNVLARAWCEAVVQRVPEFVDKKDPAHTLIASLTSEANKNFGRRFEIVSLRRLPQPEIHVKASAGA